MLNIGFGCCMMASICCMMASICPMMAIICLMMRSYGSRYFLVLIYDQHRLWMLYDGIYMAYEGESLLTMDGSLHTTH